jgi:hypothetical protein
MRATITATFQDETDGDQQTDPYKANRPAGQSEQGTFWGKLLARNPFYNRRPMRYKIGYWDEAAGDYVYQTREYVIEQITGPDAKGVVTVKGKDVLKLADDKRAQAPIANSGVLDASINSVVTSLTLSPAGVGASEYAASGTVRIDDEVMTFTRAADVLTVVRATDGTTAEDHDAGATVQQCLRYTAEPINTLIYDLLNTYASIGAGYLDTVQWQDEVDEWLSANNYTALITEPNGVNELLTELTKQGLFYIWYDEIDKKVKIKAIAPPREAVKIISDEDNILINSITSKDDPERRLSQVWVMYGIKNPTGEIDKIANYSKVYIAIDSAVEEANQYGDKRVKTIFSRWMTSSDDGLAIQLGGRLLARFSDMPKRIEYTIDAQDADVWTGGDFTLKTSTIQDAFGATNSLSAEVLSIAQQRKGSQYLVTADLTRFAGRYAFIGPNSLPNYPSATDEEKANYAFICYDTGVFLDGEPAYKII